MTASENITRAEAKERSSLIAVQSYDVVLDVTSDGPTFSTVDHRRRSPARSPGLEHLDRPHRADGPLRRPQRRRARRRRRRRRTAHHPRRTSPAENVLVVDGRRRLHEHRRGPAPVRRPGRQRDVPLHPVRVGRLASHVRLLRAARPQGDVPAHRHRAVALEGRLQRRRRREPDDHGDGTATLGLRRRRRGCRPTSRRSWPARTTRSRDSYTRRRTAPTRWASTAAQSLAQYLDADEIFDRSPSRGSRTSRSSSASATRSASTTSCSCRSSTPARWRTPAASRSTRTTSSASASPTRPTSSARTRSCTSWRTCGSATW